MIKSGLDVLILRIFSYFPMKMCKNTRWIVFVKNNKAPEFWVFNEGYTTSILQAIATPDIIIESQQNMVKICMNAGWLDSSGAALHPRKQLVRYEGSSWWSKISSTNELKKYFFLFWLFIVAYTFIIVISDHHYV